MSDKYGRYGKVKGWFHSVESAGMVDGPGIRFIIFLQGCLLNCWYCHNPDTRIIQEGKIIAAGELADEAYEFYNYMQSSGGGITISGGEPLLQPEFVEAILACCKKRGMHTVLDTSGFAELRKVQRVLDYTDLVLLDIKSYDSELYKKITGVSLKATLDFAEYLSEINKPTWIRFILVPNLTDDLLQIEVLAKYIATMSNVKKVEVLPFHKAGEYKWQLLGYDYQLSDTIPPDPEMIQSVRDIFIAYGLSIQ